MEHLKIKNGILLLLSSGISFLINTNRFLSIVYPKLAYFDDVEGDSITVFIFRLVVFTIYCWSILHLIVGSPYRFLSQFNRAIRFFIFIFIITIAAKLFYHLFLWAHGLLLFEIIEPELSGITYVWVVMGIISVLIGWLLQFQQKQKISAIEKERLIRANIQSELLALNNQINPHFLFNSLNTLKYIIQENISDSINFVDELASLYRYILQSSDKGLVTLQEELEFLNTYVYLIKARFENNFSINIDLKCATETTMIPILSLQLLIENAIKHNEISEENPLIVSIYDTKDAIIVENKIQLKVGFTQSTNKGLNNLSRRYQLLKKKDIMIEKNTNFKVSLPL